MKIDNKDDFIKWFINYIESAEAAMSINDYKSNNKIMRNAFKIKEKNRDKDFFKTAILELMNHNDFKISIPAAIDSLRYNVDEKRAVKVFKEGLKSKDKKVHFAAYWNLRIYKNKL